MTLFKENKSVQVFTNGIFSFELSSDAKTNNMRNSIAKFFMPYFKAFDFKDFEVDLKLRLLDSSFFSDKWKKKCKKNIIIRKSSAGIFNLSCKKGEIEDKNIYWDDEFVTGYCIDKSNSAIDLYVSPQSFIHAIELLRYYGLLVESTKGTTILHASAIVIEESANVIAFCGKKGAGKTTSMLKHIESKGVDYFSGDKVLIRKEGDVISARGWPDYPHIGIGTLRQHPKLVNALGLYIDDDFSDTDKILINPLDFYQYIKRPDKGIYKIKEIVIPDVLADTNNCECIKETHKDSMMASVLEDPEEFQAGKWHGLKPMLKDNCLKSDNVSALKKLNWTYASGIDMGFRVL